MISGILFDFGGTLDSDGVHWLDRFYQIYGKIGLSHLDRQSIKDAFYFADEQADQEPAMLTASWREMMDRHTRWQFQKLALDNPTLQAELAAAFNKPAERVLHRNRRALEKLKHAGYKLGIISNFYGNVETLCKEFGFFPYLDVILDSKVVGLSKPDPTIFQLALERLKLPASEVAFVGDSFERDIVPAKSVGMRTYWLLGDQVKTPPDPTRVDAILLSVEDLPKELALLGKPA